MRSTTSGASDVAVRVNGLGMHFNCVAVKHHLEAHLRPNIVSYVLSFFLLFFNLNVPKSNK